jgi:DNA topoisomerase IB
MSRTSARRVDPYPCTSPDDAQKESASLAGLVYVSDTQPGISRLTDAREFVYHDSDGRPVSDEATLERVKALAIPPAYVDVWICPEPRGHLQATGRDARRRKQYRYHPRWRQVRDTGKFDRVIAFADALPKLRKAVRSDLALPGLPREKVLAAVVALLAQTLIRVGNEEYARLNGSFGLTTLRNRHLGQRGGKMAFRFRGKSGQDHEVALGDARLVRITRRCQQLPGQHLFQYVDAEGIPHPLDSGMVNGYLRGATGSEFTAKDFRTWGGTLAAMVVLAQTPLPMHEGDAAADERSLASLEKTAVVQVAALLGNTPAVCRKSYIHPEVFAAWRDGSLAQAIPQIGSLRMLERRALALLKRRTRPKRKTR